jgi:CHAT domain-containing protein
MNWLLFLLTLLLPPAIAQADPARSRSVQEIMAALDQYPVNEVKHAAAQQVLSAPLPAGASNAELANSHLQKARAAQELGLAQRRISELRTVIELGGGINPSRVWKELSSAEFSAGNLRLAIDARLQAITLTPPKRTGQLPGDYAALANMYRQLGEFDKARQAVRDAENIIQRLRRAPNWEEKHLAWEAELEDALGRVEFSAGHYVEAEARLRRAVALKEQDSQRISAKTIESDGNPTPEQAESRLDGMTAWLALSLSRQGKLAEAETYARKAVLGAIGRGGQDGIQVAKMLQTLASVLADQGRFEESLALLDRVRATLERTGTNPDSLLLAQNQRMRAGSLTGFGRWQEALAEYEAALKLVAGDSQLTARFNTPTIGWIRTLLALKRPDEALAKARILHTNLSQRLGKSAYETAEVLAYIGAIQVSLQQDSEAIPVLRQALGVMMPIVAQESDRSGLRFSRLNYIIGGYLKALARVRGTPLEASLGIDAAGEAFVVADVLRGQAVQQAMLASSVRAAADTPALAELVRQEQDSRQERQALYTILADLLSRPADQVLPQTISNMRQRAAELESSERSAMQAIRERFPAYADLIAPKPASIKDVQAALRPGEALLSLLTTEDQTLLWAIPASGQPSFSAAPLGRRQIEEKVGKLRAALDPGNVDLDRLPAFDSAVAHQLYSALLAPVASGWQGAQHLFIAANGALARLPFAVLLTEPVSNTTPPAGLPNSQYRNWPWLIRQLSISQLPSASSLLTLRRMAPGSAKRSAFAGFGDPDFRGDGKAVPAAATRRFRSAPFPASRSISEIDYGSIAALPDTRGEILALAKALNANQAQDVFLGKNASRDAVLSADLKQRRIVAFATHGLIAGEFPGVDQPALALANPGGGKHGLLSLDDILTLKLDADWVILSACNTAAGDGRGGEAISGLGRGFFYSGSRSLLVTHWPVETVSAQKLVVGVFNELGAAPQLIRAEALRRSMLKVMNEDGGEGKFRFSYAHPLFWAPYALVGDGGK